MAGRRLILDHRHALGDAVLLTALARDVHAAYPGEYDVIVDSSYREVWANNPHARTLRPGDAAAPRTTRVKVSYRSGIQAAGRGQRVHMLSWYHRDLARQTGLNVPVTRPGGDLHLTKAERVPLVSGRYWLMMAGGKLDITCKWWLPSSYQRVVDMLAERGVRVVQAGATFNGHRHPRLVGVLDLLGKYPDARQFFNLVMHADGVIGPVTAAMHIAAAFDRPCVVLSGGREEPWWEAYVNAYQAFGPTAAAVKVEHRFLHTLGMLDCCKTKGCWKHRTVSLGLNDKWERPERLCKLPVLSGANATPQCMALIEPEHVVEAVMSYYGKEIPPIGGKPVLPEVSLQPALTPVIADDVKKRAENPKVRAPEPPPRGSYMDGGLTRLPGFGNQKPDLKTKPGELTPEQAANLAGIRDWHERSQNTSVRLGEMYPAAAQAAAPTLIDHPLIGGKLTVCVLCFGDYAAIAKSCLTSILTTIPPARLDLRIGLNAACEETRAFVMSIPNVTKVYNHHENAKKYPVMREMFHDPTCPITTPYVVWFDDDAKIVDPRVWSKLCETIVANHTLGSRLYGNVFTHDAKAVGVDWFRKAPWARGKNLRVKGTESEAPNGTVVKFVAGWFWAMATATIRAADIPCPRLNHNGGDITIGEQVHQAGFKIKQFNEQKEYVWCPPREMGGRRGFSEAFPWQRK